MQTRFTSKTITFHRPFFVKGLDGKQPAGTYEVEIDEALIPGLSSLVYRRVEARIRLQWRTLGAVGFQTVPIELDELEALAARDAGPGAFREAGQPSLR